MNIIELNIDDIINKLDRTIHKHNKMPNCFKSYVLKFNINSPLTLFRKSTFLSGNNIYLNWSVRLLEYF